MWPLAQLAGAERAGSSYINVVSKLASFSGCASLVYVLMREEALTK